MFKLYELLVNDVIYQLNLHETITSSNATLLGMEAPILIVKYAQ